MLKQRPRAIQVFPCTTVRDLPVKLGADGTLTEYRTYIQQDFAEQVSGHNQTGEDPSFFAKSLSVWSLVAA